MCPMHRKAGCCRPHAIRSSCRMKESPSNWSVPKFSSRDLSALGMGVRNIQMKGDCCPVFISIPWKSTRKEFPVHSGFSMVSLGRYHHRRTLLIGSAATERVPFFSHDMQDYPAHDRRYRKNRIGTGTCQRNRMLIRDLAGQTLSGTGSEKRINGKCCYGDSNPSRGRERPA